MRAQKSSRRSAGSHLCTLWYLGWTQLRVVSAPESCKRVTEPAITVRPMRLWVTLLLIAFLSAGSAAAQEDKKTDDLKPADPDTGESTVEETTLGMSAEPARAVGRQVCCNLYRRGPWQSFRWVEAG